MNNKSREEQTFFENITGIVEANLANENFGVNDLAQKAGMSRFLIYKKIKASRNQSISRFIREIRLNKAKEIIENENLTVSEVAYRVGFGSPSYFTKCFHDHFGFAPGDYLKNSSGASNLYKSQKKIKYRVILSTLLVILATVTIIYFLGQIIPNKSRIPTEKSIAILPLKNSGADPEVQQLADGIVEDILNRLSKVSSLIVKSRNSSEIYRSSTKASPEIAKELGVSYLAEGTILKEGNNIRIYIQLIDAVNDDHLWSEQYDKDLAGIFDFISGVSRQIAGELEAVLSANEIDEIERTFTKNPEAYQLYLKGRYFWSRRTKEDLDKSENYFKEALKTDPRYSLAWAGLADTYFIKAYWRWIDQEEGIRKSKECARRSLEINPNLAETHAVLGGISTWFDLNWDEAENQLKKAIELNPNYALAHQYYAELLRVRGRFMEAIEHCNIAIELDPNAPAHYSVRSGCLYNLERFSEMLKDTRKVVERNRKYAVVHIRNVSAYFLMNDDLNAIKELKTMVSLSDPTYLQKYPPEYAYSKSGKVGLIYWLIDWLLKEDTGDNSIGLFNDKFSIAQLYALVRDWDNAFKCLEEYSNGPFNTTRAPHLKYDLNFKPVSSDPRFLDLLTKMRLEDL